MQHFDQIGQCSSKLYKVIARYDKVMQIHGTTMIIHSQVMHSVAICGKETTGNVISHENNRIYQL